MSIPGVKEHDTSLGWHVVRLHYTADPEKRGSDWPIKTRKMLSYTKTDWDREFEIDWAAGQGDCWFDADLIREHYLPRAGSSSYLGYLQKSEGHPPELIRPEKGGRLRVWKIPAWLKRAADSWDGLYYYRYVIFADVAEGLEKRDYSAAYVLDRLRFELVAAFHGHLSPHDFAAALDLLGRWYSEPKLEDYPLLGVEANNHGGTVLNELVNHLRYPNIYVQEQFNEVGASLGRRIGWYTTAKNKPIIIDNLAKVLGEKEIIIHDPALLNEMLRFTNTDGKLGAQGSNHDDRVMAAAGVIQMHKVAPAVERWKPPLTGWRAGSASEKNTKAWIGV